MGKLKITKKQAELLGLTENVNKKLIITKEQYDRIFGSKIITESEVKGGLNRVDSEFKKAFTGKNVQNLRPVAEDKFKITKPNKSVPKLRLESDNDLTHETQELIKYLYRKSEELSPFWGENGLSYDDICDNLLSKGIIVSKNGKCELSKKLGDPQTAIKALENELASMLGQDVDNIDEVDGEDYEQASRSQEYGINPYSDQDPDINSLNDENGIVGLDILNHEPFKSLPDTRSGMSNVRPKLPNLDMSDASLVMFSKEDFVDHEVQGPKMVHKFHGYITAFVNKFGEQPIFVNLVDGLNGSAEIANEKFLQWKERGNAAKQSWIDGERSKGSSGLDEDSENDHERILSYLKSNFNTKPKELGDVDIKKKLADLRAKSQAQDAERFAKRDAENTAGIGKKKITTKNVSNEPQRPTGQIDIFGDVEETTTAASSGAFVGKLSINKPIGSIPIVGKKYDDIDGIPVVGEDVNETLTAAGAGNYQYDTPGGLTMDLGKSNPKTKAEKTPQWAGGSFVKQPECSKPNNNKAAQNGGCNSGASSLKTIKGKGSINAPSLSEGIMREALKLQHDKNQNKLIVISDLEGRAGSQETFNNKAILKQNGFIWTGTNWAIPVENLEVAKKTLSLINKADYLIDTLEDLEEAVDNSGADNKSLLKARLDQYISDLANATDEAALSAEIRRYLTFFSKFHSYSFHNRMLIFIQKPDATKVASYKLWQSKFRQVNKGAKAITVLAPISTNNNQPIGNETDDELSNELGGKQTVTRFRAVSVFDISDTTPIDERGDVPDTPQWWGDNTPSETADMLFNAVSEVAVDLGIRVTQSDAKGGEKGFSAGDHINLSSDVSGAGRLSTMIHEIAHELMHHKKTAIYYIDNGFGKESYALGELQAESVSYVVLKHYGIPVSHHTTYLALWNANKDKIQKNLEIISKVSQFIITKIDEQVNQTK